MKTQQRITGGGRAGRYVLALFAVVLATVTMVGTPALAQDPEVGNVNGYAPAKTRADYDSGSTGFDYAKMDLRAAVWLDRGEDEIYQKGDEMGVGFQVNQDAYAVVYRIDIEGRVAVLWPRSRFDDGFVFGGHEYLLPVAGARKLRVAAAAGEGYVETVVSKYPFDLRDLEIDFHHEPTADRYDFLVAGDPFLAINEVNYAVTGLEDSAEYVVTNYTSYYVHQAVDHPRYLCTQCHFEDDVAYHPYRDTCTLEISYDYGWSNRWYSDYGYYPVYVNPVYVYVDPWTWRPWVNFWYYPSYVCAPYYGYGWGASYCYSWGYSPYYRGSSHSYYDDGYRRYRPLNRVADDGTRTKSREYARVSSMVKGDGPDARQRDAMANRSRLKDTDAVRGGGAANRTVDGKFRGEDRAARSRPTIDTAVRTRGSAGLRIRDGGSLKGGSRTGASRSTGSEFRHKAGSSRSPSSFTTVPRTAGGGVRGTSQIRGSENSGGSRANQVKPGARSAGKGGTGSRTLKPVEPRNKGTRVWNSGRTQQGDRGSRSGQVRPGSSSSGNTSRSTSKGSRSVQPQKRNWDTSSDKGSRSSVKSRSSGSKSTPSKRSSSKSSSVKSRSGGSKSSGSSGRSSGSRSSGSSRGGGRGSGSSRGR